MAGKGITVLLATGDVVFLERRGARSNRGGGEFSRAAVLHRSLQTLRTLLESSDPRKTRGMAPEAAALVARLLSAPWTLRSFEIEHLEAILERSPELAAAAAAAGIDPRELLGAIAGLSFAEKVFLVDLAIQAQSPTAAAATPEEG